MDNLNKRMLDRLERWKTNQSNVTEKVTPAPEKKRSVVMQTYVPRREYGDEVSERDMQAWGKEYMNNPIYRGFR